MSRFDKFVEMDINDLHNLTTSFIECKNVLSTDDKAALILLYSMNGLDFDINERLCSKLLKDEDIELRGLAICCVGHIARVYKKLVKEEILHYMLDHYNKGDPLYYRVDDALDDIEGSLKIKRKDIIKKFSK
ncbi:MAG: hypothetical protein KA998_04295 [Rickettsiaceae bacterium]|nr:hypothetical protein [Rickettsiaceae bacterium]